jgi:hypothetical protein
MSFNPFVSTSNSIEFPAGVDETSVVVTSKSTTPGVPKALFYRVGRHASVHMLYTTLTVNFSATYAIPVGYKPYEITAGVYSLLSQSGITITSSTYMTATTSPGTVSYLLN